MSLSIVIPTLGREEVLVDTLRQVLALPEAHEILLVDQTAAHKETTERQLLAWDRQRAVRWIRQSQASIPQAMNRGLSLAASDIVLFLDDDIIPCPQLSQAHLRAHREYPEAWAVAGQVLQPGETPENIARPAPDTGFYRDLHFPFYSSRPAWITNVMAGNLSVKKSQALAAGAFDERFRGAAYRFETEFARRVIKQGGRIFFEPAASIRHLRASKGGTRTKGNHLTSASPYHGFGDYYLALQHGMTAETLGYMLRRPIREVCTRFHLRHPWYIPIKWLGEVRAAAAAFRCHFHGSPSRLVGRGPAASHSSESEA